MQRIPVIVLTTSSAPQDVARSYQLHANSYVIKPVTLERFTAVVREVLSYWLRCVTLPG